MCFGFVLILQRRQTLKLTWKFDLHNISGLQTLNGQKHWESSNFPYIVHIKLLYFKTGRPQPGKVSYAVFTNKLYRCKEKKKINQNLQFLRLLTIATNEF